MTKKETFATIKNILNDLGNTDFDAFIDHEVELLSRKRSSSSKPTKRQVENEKVKEYISDILLKADGSMSATAITKTINSEDVSLNRVTSLLTQMVKNDKTVVREGVKGKAMFTLA